MWKWIKLNNKFIFIWWNRATGIGREYNLRMNCFALVVGCGESGRGSGSGNCNASPCRSSRENHDEFYSYNNASNL